MSLESLNAEQRRIAETVDGLVRVDAGPGTGKTHTLVERYMRIVGGGVPPSDVLMVTFTNNAAQEMGDRLRNRIKEEADSLRDSDSDRSEELMRMIPEVRTSTFDSYCSRIVRSNSDAVSDFFGLEHRLSRSAVLESNDTLNREHFAAFYSSFMAEHASWYPDLSALAAGHERELYNLIGRLMSRGIIPLKDYDWFLDGMDRLKGDPEKVARRISEVFGCGSLDKFVETERGKYYPPDEESDYDDQAKEAAYENRRDLINFIHDVYYGYIARSVRDNRLTFDLTALFAFVSLYGSAECRASSSVRYLMVDEFQDTNEMQMMICLMLLKDPNLCAVGDWKQGIYGFRNATVDNIIRFGEKVRSLARLLNADGVDRAVPAFRSIREESISMRVNYRSSSLVLEKAFAALEAKGAKDDPHETYGDDVTFLEADNGDFDGHTRFEAYTWGDRELEAIIDQITRYVGSGEYRIRDGEGYRAPRFGDIAVLFKTTKMCNKMYDLMQKAGIPVFLQGDLDIMSSVPGKLALAWLRYVNDESDRRGLNTILTHLGFSMAQIDHMRREARENAETGGRRSDAYPVFVTEQRKYLLRRKKRPNDLLTSIFAFHGIGQDDPVEADIAQAIIRVVSTSFSGSLVTIPDIIRMMEQDIAGGTTYNVDALPDRDAVLVQTMHKSKGLEYPIVIVGGLNQRVMPSAPKPDGIFSFHEDEGVRIRNVLVRSGEDVAICPSWNSALIRKTRAGSYDEERRVLFVALSRAKQYITITSSKSHSRFFSHFKTVEKKQVDDFPMPCPLPRHSGDTGMSRPPEIPEYRRRRVTLAVHDLMTYVPAHDLVGDDSPRGKEYGTMVHSAAEVMAMGGEAPDIPEAPRIREVLSSLDGADLIVERECALPLGRVTVRGIIDLLAIWPDRAEVHDWKTDFDDRNRDSYRIQLSVYARVVEGVLKRPVRCFVQYVSRGVTAEVDPMSADELRRLAEEHLDER